jgi:uncharacterized repeat protein (TIGR01451 family)
LDVSKVGPDEARVGDRVRFTIRVTNSGEGVLTNVQIVDLPDQNLEAVQLTQGGLRRESDQALYWVRGTLGPGETATYEIVCVCRGEAAAARNLVEVTADGGIREAADAQFPIRPRPQPQPPVLPDTQPSPRTQPSPVQPSPAAPGQLAVSVASLGNVAVGRNASFVIEVTNRSNEPDQSVVITVSIPPSFGNLRVVQDQQQVSVTSVPEGVVIGPIQVLRAGERISIRVESTARQPGAHRVRVRAASRRAEAVEGETAITVVPGQ